MATAKNIESVYGLTPLQEGILYHSLQSTDPGVYLGQYSAVLEGPLEPDLLRDAWQQATARHASLRTLFAWRRQEQRPLQIVRERVPLPWRFEDWSSMDVAERSKTWQLSIDNQRAQGFKLDRAPLYRLLLIRMASEEHRFLFSYHHLLFDGWSLRLLLDEVARIYAASSENKPLDLGLTGSFVDYVNWLDSRDWREADRYWAKRLGDFDSPTPLELPRPEPQQEDRPFGFHAVTRQLAPEVLSGLERIAREQRVTLSTIFLGAWSLLLARYADRNDVVFGSAQAGRPAEIDRVQQTVGLFINTIPVRTRIEPERKLADWLRALQQQQLEAQEHQYLPLARAQKASGVPPGQRLFESLLVYQGVPAAAAHGHAWRTVNEAFLEYGNYPLALLVRPGTPFMLTAVHELARIETDAAERLLGHVEQLLQNFIQHPGAAVSEIDLLAPAERKLLLETWSGASEDGPSGRLAEDLMAGQCDIQQMHALIEQVGRNAPHAIALEQADERVTYADLLDRADHLAGLMRERGLGSGGFGAVFLERSPRAVIAMLAVLKAGAAYVPLNPAFPPARIQVMFEELADQAGRQDSRLLVLTDEDLAVRLPSIASDALILSECFALPSETSAVTSDVGPDATAYVMYTSGSTGRPKGVLVSHANLVASTQARRSHYPESPGRFLLLSSLASDSSIAGLFWTLSVGGTLIMPRERQEQALKDIVDMIRDHQVTHLLTLPSLYAMLLDHAQGEDLRSLRCAIVAGEACHKAVVEAHRRQIPDALLSNEYGPSEASVWSSQARLDTRRSGDQVPIGRPVKGWRLYVLDSQRRLVPPGLPGELHIGGAGVSHGYLADPELTRERFVTDDYWDGDAARLYRTGDRVRFLGDGQLVFLGRVDNQFKVRGFRVEPEEIEQVLSQYSGVREAAVISVTSGEPCSEESSEPVPASRVVAYLGVSGEPPNATLLRDFLRERLPEHMVPNAFVALDALPRSTGGKVDLAALRAFAIPSESTADYAPPRNDAEKTLVEIWQTALNASQVGIHDNFFQIGGDSLLSIRVLASATRRGYEISPSDFFARPTVAEQALLMKPIVTSTETDRGGSATKAPSAGEPFALAKFDSAGLAAIARQLDVTDSEDS